MLKKNFYKNIETGEIFKETSDNAKYLKVSPWKTGEDRRINIDDLKKLEVEGKVTKLPWDNALEELNTIWNNTDRYWTHDDNEYKSLGKSYISKNNLPPRHTFVYRGTTGDGKEWLYEETFYLTMFQGQLYWVEFYHYTQKRICQFEGIDVPPNTDNGQWTNMRNLHPIYVKDKNTNEWKMI